MKKTLISGLLILLSFQQVFAEQFLDFTWERRLHPSQRMWPGMEIDEVVITGYTGNGTEVTIPGVINGMPVTAIGSNAFADKNLTGVTIPEEGIQEIGERAFAFNQLTHVTFPNSISVIGADAFAYNRLTGIDFPGGVYTIRNGAFSNNMLTSVSLPDGLVHIGEGAFARNRLTCVTIPGSVHFIDPAAFAHNRLASIAIPDGVHTIEYAAFAGNPLTSITIGADVFLAWEVLGDGGSFDHVYTDGGRLAGTYTRANPESTEWVREE